MKLLLALCGLLCVNTLANAAPQPADRVIAVDERATRPLVNGVVIPRTTEIPFSPGMTVSHVLTRFAGGFSEHISFYLVRSGQLQRLDTRALEQGKDVELKAWDIIVIKSPQPQ